MDLQHDDSEYNFKSHCYLMIVFIVISH